MNGTKKTTTNTNEKQDLSSPGTWGSDIMTGQSTYPPEKALVKTEVASKNKVAETKKAGESLDDAKKKLLGYWKENDKNGTMQIEPLEDTKDLKILILSLKDNTEREKKDMRLLYSLIKSKKGEEQAKKIYEEAISHALKKDKYGVVTKVDVAYFRKPFEAEYGENSESGSPGRTFGFYYCTKDCQKGEAKGGSTLDENTQGWFTYDATPAKKVTFGRNISAGDDEYSGTASISEAYDHIKGEFTPKGSSNDSSLSTDEEKEILAVFEEEETGMVAKKDKPEEKVKSEFMPGNEGAFRKRLVTWATDKAKDKWVSLDEVNMMNAMYGPGVGNFLYRYDEKNNRIYFIGIKGTADANNSGYIIIKEQGADLTRNFFSNGAEGLNDTLLKDMDSNQIITESMGEATKRGETLEGSQDAITTVTQTALFEIHKKEERFVKYSDLKTGYLDKLEGPLKEDFIKKRYSELKAVEIAGLAMKELQTRIDKEIQANPELTSAIKPENDFVLKLSLSKDGKVTVELKTVEDKKKIKELIGDDKKLAKGADLDKMIDQKSEELTKKLGPLGMFLKWFKVDLKSDVADFYKTGKKSLFLTIAGLFTSVEIGRRVLIGKSIESTKDVEKLAGKNGGVLEKDHSIKGKDYKLEGYKITIPKGKGIKPGASFSVEIDKEVVSVGPEEKKEEKKGKVSWSSFSSKSSSDGFVSKDKEIIIPVNTVIPEKTTLPKGAKIEKITTTV
jgi:hypothetical protein